MSGTLFQLEKLSCSYTREEEKKVLYIEKLSIPRGQLVFLLGPSGSGKSTLLETLGLMNQTIASGDVHFYTDGDKAPIRFAGLWKEGSEARLNEVRRNFFSFVFQQTNLMENFTAYENVALSRMIKSGAGEKEAALQAAPMMKRVNLPLSMVGFETSAMNLSGGQKQRLAFVRALSSNYTVLFGDEPTGNLDPQNAHELFEVIRSNISEHTSALIVSHDLELALRHADQIVVISKSETGSYGEVKPENIFIREQFANLSDTERHQFKNKLFGLFRSGAEAAVPASEGIAAPAHNRSFRQLFFVKEAKALSGKMYTNFLILSCILLFTFLAIGFANGSLDYLDKKLNNAFVNWLTITIPLSYDTKDLKALEKKLNSPEYTSRFQYDKVTPFKETVFEIYDPVEGETKRVQGRTLNEDDKKFLDDYLLEGKNTVQNKAGGFDPKSLSVIILEKTLKENHYDEKNTDIIWMRSETREDDDAVIVVPIPVRSIVKQLPGDNEMAWSQMFHRAFQFDSRNFNPHTKHDLRIILRQPEEEVKKIRKEIGDWIEAKKAGFAFKPEAPELERYNETYNPYFLIRINFFPQPDTSEYIESFYRELKKLPSLAKDTTMYSRMYDYSDIDQEAIGRFDREGQNDYLSVYFDNLDSVRAFADALYQEAKVKGEEARMRVDTSKISEKENFNFLSKVTKIIGLLLVLFGAIAASLYCFNLLKMHLSKVQMNIGTFKALGLSNRKTLRIYFSIILFFVITAGLVSFVIAYLLGTILDQMLIGSQNVEAGIAYFKLLDIKTVFAFLLILISTIAVSFFTITKMLSKTPGDLIYNR